ncbi:class I adenylate-forming enzyme family protein [Alicyclobacillus ferrooxydans]|uniref:AMP-dependent synthetase n=1 Tax=Alicyclobacillus ferrooxydans TaxID=471514 RepID=A0A0P9EM54_9BACL|nr:AMP-binding protein [Alicyclobacillus ferrooxydans]KPV44420.1 hypothetical protein AN477_07305 [Alicyclobacillus ferrooxydans]
MLPIVDRPQELTYRNGERPLHEVLLKHAAEQPEKTAIIWYGAVTSFGQLADWVNRFAIVLKRLGVTPGDRVALFLHNCPQYYVAHYAAQLIGAIVSPVSPAYKAMELSYQVSDLDAKVLVTAESLYPVVQEAGDSVSLDHVVLTHYGTLLPSDPAWTVPDELLVPRANATDSEAKPPEVMTTFKIQELDTTTPDTDPSVIDRRQSAIDLDLDFRSSGRLASVIDMFTAINDVPPGTRVEPEQVSLDDTCLLVYTSGTTGRPKGAMLSYRNALFKTVASGLANGVKQDDRVLSVMPLSHIAGMLMGLNVPIYTGCTVILMYRFDPKAILEALSRSRATWWYSTTPMNVAVMASAKETEAVYNLSHLRTNLCTSFGIQLTPEIAEQWTEFTGECAIYEAAYGLSETHTADTFMPAEAIKWGTQGIPVYQTEIRIVDPDTHRDLPRGEQGEVFVRGPGVFQGYWRNPEATQRTLENGWVKTGDVGRLDDHGYLTFLGRIKEMIKVSGFSVFPEDVEALLMAHPSVAQVAVIGVPDPKRGEVVKAFIVRKPSMQGPAQDGTAAGEDNITPADIIDWAKSHMASYKVPRFVEFIEALPTSSTGKVLRRMLAHE